MPLTLETMLQVLPGGQPPWDPGSEDEKRKVDRLAARDGGDGPYTRGYLWQKYLTEQLREKSSWMSDSLTGLGFPNPLLQQAVGYIEFDVSFAGDEQVERAARGTGYFFGAILYDHRGNGEGFDRTSLDIGQVADGANGIPAVRLAAADVYHAPDPAGATATCWAADKQDSSNPCYILTAKHAVAGLGKGQRVAMASGGFAKLHDFCESSVDAAVIEPNTGPTAPVALAIDADPAVGLGVSFDGSVSSRLSGRITKTWIHPTDSDAYDPQRVLFDVTGVKGDSGALVRLDSTGEAVGIYTGIKKGRSSQEGMSQAIWQATDLLNIDLYE